MLCQSDRGANGMDRSVNFRSGAQVGLHFAGCKLPAPTSCYCCFCRLSFRLSNFLPACPAVYLSGLFVCLYLQCTCTSKLLCMVCTSLRSVCASMRAHVC